MRSKAVGIAFLFASALAFASCGSGPSGGGFTPAGTDAGDAADAGGGPGHADASDDTGRPPALDSGMTSACTTCSTDLHAVLDCGGHLLRTCPDNQGCLPGGKCGPACDSATVNQSTVGCDYFSINPDVIQNGTGAFTGPGQCFAAYIANTWTSPVTISVDYNGTSLNASDFARIPSGSGPSISYAPLPKGKLPPGEVAILFLADADASLGYSSLLCPGGVTPAITTSDVAVHGTGIGKAFHISTSAPVAAYDIYPYGGGQTALASATLLLPTSAWDTNYVAVDAFTASTVASSLGAVPTLDIVAQDDGTQVTIRPTADIVAGPGVAAASAGSPVTYNLNRGQVLQFTQQSELTGSAIQANKRVGLWGGSSCLNIDPGTCCCDAAHQQLPPVKALGHEYVAVRYRNRDDTATTDEAPPWRFVGAVDGTTLAYDPSPPAGAPTTLASGQLVQFNAPGPFVVASQDASHPFYISAHMSGCETYFDPSDCRGDPEYVNVVAAEQYLGSYVFFTDPTYPETNLVLVRGAPYADVTLDCAGTLGGWQPIGSGKYQFTRLDLSRHNFDPQGKCDNGRHEIKSTSPFGLTVWGWGSAETGGVFGDPAFGGFYTQCVSYAYPAGMSVKPINKVVVPTVPK